MSTSSTGLQGKVALVTGGSRGIGAAIVKRLVRDGAAVAFTFASAQAKADALVREIESSGGRALSIRADSADADALTAAVDQAAKAFGRLDVLVNNAGIATTGPLAEFTLADFDRMVAINIRGVFVATQAAVRHMGDGGRVITIGSCVADRFAWVGGGPYAMTKAAVAALGRGMARDLGPRGITVNTVQPGPTDTDMNPADGPQAADMQSQMAISRHGHADEIAAMVAYLAGPDAGFVTGAALTIDGGLNA